MPKVRGRSTSVEPSLLEAQLGELVVRGAPEVVLTGVHLGTYGWDLQPRIDLGTLIQRLLQASSGVRLRLGSLDPHELDEGFCGLVAGSDRICRHLHLPVQSGDDGVLRRMRRAHRVEHLERVVPQLAAAIPGVAIGTDLIVGFPGEDSRAFDNTYGLIETLPIAYAHVFSYSIREGTEAAQMPDKVDARVKVVRSRHLRALSRRKWAAFIRASQGQLMSAVVYRRRDRRSGDLLALSDNYIEF
ncbi:MAG TPA: radical SAM protein, partial [Nannocystis exedens]|nr:radical SAM protein [Nannocystis exedens]